MAGRHGESIHTTESIPHLKLMTNLIAHFSMKKFYWIESLQSYNEGGWNYLEQLHNFVDNGMGDHSFINAVSGIVNRGCHNPPCGTG